MKIKRNIQSMYQKMLRKKKKKMIGKEKKIYYVIINDFDKFMYSHLLHRGRKHFVVIVYLLSPQKKLQSAILKIAFKLMVNKRLKYLRKVNILN